MPRYIDAELLKRELYGIGCVHGGIRAAIKSVIDAVPAADVEEVKHGHWEEVETVSYEEHEVASMRCSECDRYHNEVYHYGDPTEMAHRCPYCGAKMDGKENKE
jgi:DNA-directed RNA polymerase subunit RPC12/RpoP